MHFGIDVASFQHVEPSNLPIDWELARQDLSARGGADQPFVLIKLSEGDSYVNPFAISGPLNPLPTSDFDGAKNAGFAIAFYHFVHASVSADAQLALIKRYLPSGCGIFLDLEDLGLDGRTKADAFAVAEAMINDPVVLGIYVNDDWFSATPESLKIKNLWLADPSNLFLTVPRQITQIASGGVAGVPTTVDVNTASDLAWAQTYLPSQAAPAQPEPVDAPIAQEPASPPQVQLSPIQEAINHMPTIEENSTDIRFVKIAQGLLNANGSNLAIDGGFGPLTLREVLAFQHGHGLAADGIVGPLTWAALLGA